MKGYFICIMFLWTLVAVHHLIRLVRRKHPLSLMVALYPAGWGVWAAREAGILPLQYTHIATAASLAIGLPAASLCIATWIFEWSRREPPTPYD